MGNRTFTMVKPEAVQAGNTGEILKMIEENGFRIVALKKVQLTKQRAAIFYQVHKERPFYGELVDYMSSGHIIAAILEKETQFMNLKNPNSLSEEELKQYNYRKNVYFEIDEDQEESEEECERGGKRGGRMSQNTRPSSDFRPL